MRLISDIRSLHFKEKIELKASLFLQVVGSPKLKLQGIMTNEQLYKGIVDCFLKTYKEAGLRGLYRGVGMGLKTDFIMLSCLSILL